MFKNDKEIIVLRSRDKMPQILNVGDFLLDLSDHNINYSVDVLNVKKLIPTQIEFNDDKVKSLIKDKYHTSESSSPIITTLDNFILDGHHRWKACLEDNIENIKSLVINISFSDLYDFTKNKKYIKYNTINESYNFNTNTSISSYMVNSSNYSNFENRNPNNDKCKSKIDFKEFFNDWLKKNTNTDKSLTEDEGGGAVGSSGAGSSSGSSGVSSAAAISSTTNIAYTDKPLFLNKRKIKQEEF